MIPVPQAEEAGAVAPEHTALRQRGLRIDHHIVDTVPERVADLALAAMPRVARDMFGPIHAAAAALSRARIASATS